MSKRITLTKKQLQEKAAVELVELCLSLSDDGVLTEQEIGLLQGWLAENEGSEIPAFGFLKEVVSAALSDGRLEYEEVREIQLAIERVLPASYRKPVKEKRVACEKEFQKKNAVSGFYDVLLTGNRYEGRGKNVSRYLKAGDRVLLQRQPNNPYDKNAVMVLAQGKHEVGFIPAAIVPKVARLLDEGMFYQAHVVHILTKGVAPLPIIDIEMVSPGSDYDKSEFDKVVVGSPVRRGLFFGLGLSLWDVVVIGSAIVLTLAVFG